MAAGGGVVTNANCAAKVAAMALAPLNVAFGLDKVFVTTMQAISGAGYPGVPSLDILGRIIQWREGDEILVLENEFPSCVLAWSPLQHRGVSLRLVVCGSDPEEALLAAVTPRTRAVCVSHVSYFTSWRVDRALLAGQLRSRNIRKDRSFLERERKRSIR